jgi:hypothetical protein
MMTLIIALVLSFAQAPSTTGRIGGVVMKAGTFLQQTLPNARIELREGPGTLLIVRTDAAGRFVFSNLSAGRYRLLLTEDGSIRQDYGQIVLAPGQQKTDVVFRLEAAPTIAGTVTGDGGIPVPNILVQALRRAYDIRGNPRLAITASALTDDRGQYRIFWVDPGDYFVQAGLLPVATLGDPEQQSGPRPAFAPIYFPGVTEPEGTKPIRVALGREIDGVDFRLRGQALATVAGYITSAVTRRPVAASITLSPVEDANISRYQAQGNAQGTFAIGEVPPGSYIVSARSGSGAEQVAAFARIRIPAFLRPPFTYDLRLSLNPGLQVSGRLFFSDAEAVADLRTVRVGLASVDFPSPAAGAPQRDGQFLINDVLPGDYLLTVSGLPEDFYVRAAPVDVRIPSAAPIQVLLDAAGGRLSVAVFDQQNQPRRAAQVVLVPDAARRNRPDQHRSATAGEDGQVTIRGIPPGDYKVLAWESIEPNAYLNKEYLRSYEDFGTTVRIVSGQNAGVAVRTIPAEQ